MVRRIIWSNKADLIFSEILEFYFKRNGTKTYSRKVSSEIKQILNLLIKHPLLGKKTEFKNIRFIIKGNFKIFYKTESDKIIILMVWDTRQYPKSLGLK